MTMGRTVLAAAMTTAIIMRGMRMAMTGMEMMATKGMKITMRGMGMTGTKISMTAMGMMAMNTATRVMDMAAMKITMRGMMAMTITMTGMEMTAMDTTTTSMAIAIITIMRMRFLLPGAWRHPLFTAGKRLSISWRNLIRTEYTVWSCGQRVWCLLTTAVGFILTMYRRKEMSEAGNLM